LFKKGKVIRKIDQDKLVEQLLMEIENIEIEKNGEN
jgi:hypothetical protein